MDASSTFYQFTAHTLQGEEVTMKDYAGKVIIVVNTASKCGFTPQYGELEQLYRTYKERGLVILGFPCNQFANQEPGSTNDIEQTCYVNYGVTFPMFEKVKVNGGDAHPIFKYLKKELPALLGKSIKWNFTKFILDTKGKPVKRFAPSTSPAAMIPIIESLLL